MILVLVPVLCAVAGLVLYAGLRVTGAFGIVGDSDRGDGWRASSRGDLTLRERVNEIPPGWLLAVIVVASLWILGWLIVLGIGLNLLS
ncbi:MAG: hypothetical protein ABR540_21960 [Acidimicrobiales bacterium]